MSELFAQLLLPIVLIFLGAVSFCLLFDPDHQAD